MKPQEPQILLNTKQDSKKLTLIIKTCVRLLRRSVGKQKHGKRRSNLSKVMYGIFYRLRTGCSWRNIPREYGNWRTVYDWYRRIISIGLFKNISKQLKNTYLSEKHPHGVKRVIIDGSLIRSSSRLDIARNNPRRGNKKVINRSTVSDMYGAPLDFRYARGTAHDSRFCIPQLQRLMHQKIIHNKFALHADKGYDSMHIRLCVVKYGGLPHIPARKNKYDYVRIAHYDARRGRIEATHSWINAFHSLGHIRDCFFNSINQITYLACGLIYTRFMNIKSLKKALGSC